VTTPAVVMQPTIRKDHARVRRWDRVFFSVMSLVILAAVLFGFAKTYFLAGMVAAPLPNRLIHVHGAAFSLWILLLIVQTALISARQVKIHRTLGMAGFCLAVAMLVLGTLAAVDALKRGSGPLGLDPQTFLVVPLSAIFLFAILIAAAYRQRLKAEAHKRLILIGTIALLDAAVGRWPVATLQAQPKLQDLVILAFLLVVAGYDLLSLRRISKTTLWAAGLVIVVHAVRVPIGLTPMWHRFAAYVQIHG
jgi:hypothetical protein